MKEIKEKPPMGKSKSPKIKDASGIPKTAMEQVLLRARNETASALTETPGSGQEGNYTETARMEKQVQMGTEYGTEQSTAAMYRAGKKLAQRRAGQRRMRDMAQTTAAAPGPAVTAEGREMPNIKQASAPLRCNKPLPKERKAPHSGRPPLRSARQSSKTAKEVLRRQEQGRRLAIRAAQAGKKATERTVKVLVATLRKTVELALAALQSLIAAVAAGGTVALVIVLLICMVAMVASSAYGIFFTSQANATSVTAQDAVLLLGNEHRDAISAIENSVSHDRVETVSNDGVYYIRWQDVLAVYAAQYAGADNGASVAVFTSEQLDALRGVLWEMNAVGYTVYDNTVTIQAADGTTSTMTERVLRIELTHKTPNEMAAAHSYNARQREYLTLLRGQDTAALWAQMLGGYTPGSGQTMTPAAGTALAYGLQWPLPVAGSITSRFGYRTDPFTGETKYHNGTDIAAAGGTEILAAAGGTVTVANALDSWGGGYGFYVKIDHGGGLETLYAHCSSICVTVGERVQAGQVIGYVGSTGRATGDHLHFECYYNGKQQDILS